MRPLVFALPLLVATLPLLAVGAALGQAQFTPTQPMVTLDSPSVFIPSRDCPVGLSARRESGGQTLWTTALEDGAKPQLRLEKGVGNGAGDGTGVHVELTSSSHQPIRQVELAVHYLAPGLHTMLIKTQLDGTAAPGDRNKTFDLAATGGASLQLTGDLLLGGAASVTRVTLLRVNYANGTSWQTSAQKSCSVAPNGIMQVSAH
jgi:hypothetical protein